MEKLSKEILTELLEERGSPCVSIFFNTQRMALQEKLDRIKLDNLLRAAEERLVSQGVRAAEAHDFLRPAWQFLDPIHEMFWQHQGRSLALFVSRDFFRYRRLPIAVKEVLVVSQNFFLKPLLPLFSGNTLFYLLTLSLNGVGLFYGTQANITPVDLASLPGRLATALARNDVGEDIPGEILVSAGAVGRERPILSQERTPSDVAKNKILEFFQEIRWGIDEFLAGERVPLILAGTNYLTSVYKEVNTYPHLIDDCVVGDQTETTEEALHQRAWSLMEPRFEEAWDTAAARYRQLGGSGRTSRDIEEIVPAAFQGRIDVLFTAPVLEQYGKFDLPTGTVSLENKPGPGTIDLFDLATARTLLGGGTAFVVPPEKIPDTGPIAALFRY